MDAQQTTPFYRLWQTDNQHIRDRILGLLPHEDIAALRLASSACCNITTKRLFKRIHVTFTPNTFTKQSRVHALARIGHHVEHLTFHFAHSPATFLPPLIHPLTGAEISFLYTPHTSMASVLARPKYANTELGEILTQQYPPLFHAATNVPSFINALAHVPNLRHLTLRTPGQDPRERYRRDAVDYALISLRIALERNPLTALSQLSLAHLHPAALQYLRAAPAASLGALPSSPRRWRQIRKLSLAVESWDFSDTSTPGRDHLRIMDDYLRAMAPSLEKLSFTWLGLLTSPMSPLPPAPGRTPIHFPRLRHMGVRNATMHAPQLADLVGAHSATVREFDFDNVVLADGGRWNDALAPLRVDGDDEEIGERRHREDLDADLVSEIAAAREASAAFTTKLKKKRKGRRRVDEVVVDQLDVKTKQSSHRHWRPSDAEQEVESRDKQHHRRHGSRHRKKRHAEDDKESRPSPGPSRSNSDRSILRKQPSNMSSMAPEAECYRPAGPVRTLSNISAPIMDTTQQPVLLQPTTYDPNRRHAADVDPDEGISSAKEAVLLKLSAQFSSSSSSSSKKQVPSHGPDSCAMAARLREGLFGKSYVSVLPDARSMSSQSALVPLMFTRS
ncbi:Meiotic recombination protein rec14 [Verticillium dahliae VDG1]|nr:Meiotic recombination protein rec14 [Verticillium dahliae VDG1]